MPLPPNPVLRAAVRWLERLPASGYARTRALFTAHTEFSDIAPTQYDAAYSWIHDVGLLEYSEDDVPASHRVFNAALIASKDPWLVDADILIRDPQELPKDASDAAASIGLDEHDAFNLVKESWSKVNTEERARIGQAGEISLVNLLLDHTDARIDHVASWSDSFGYDIAVRDPLHPSHLEVKSTTRHNRISIYLSRNEFDMMSHDPIWCMVVLHLSPDLKPDAIATVPNSWIKGQAPADNGIYGRWESFRLDIPPEVLNPGLSVIQPLLNPEKHSLLEASSWFPN